MQLPVVSSLNQEAGWYGLYEIILFVCGIVFWTNMKKSVLFSSCSNEIKLVAFHCHIYTKNKWHSFVLITELLYHVVKVDWIYCWIIFVCFIDNYSIIMKVAVRKNLSPENLHNFLTKNDLREIFWKAGRDVIDLISSGRWLCIFLRYKKKSF